MNVQNVHYIIEEVKFVQDYLQWCKEQGIRDRKNVDNMKEFVEDFLCGLDDCYYYCDNSDEIEEKMLSILTSAKIKNIKIVEMEID